MFQPLSSDSSPNLINSVDRKRKHITEEPQSDPQQNIGTTAYDHTYANTKTIIKTHSFQSPMNYLITVFTYAILADEHFILIHINLFNAACIKINS